MEEADERIQYIIIVTLGITVGIIIQTPGHYLGYNHPDPEDYYGWRKGGRWGGGEGEDPVHNNCDTGDYYGHDSLDRCTGDRSRNFFLAM